MHPKEIGATLVNDGVPYLDFMRQIAQRLPCRSYFEIGTAEGDSLRAVECDSVSVDPRFRISQDVLTGRRAAHFFQITSDEFFDRYDLDAYLPGGPDICFLDGLHRFDVLLRDFINTEKYCHDRSVILLHDCLPVNFRMAEPVQRIDESEDVSTRWWWTGDVWRLLPILRVHRPDLRILQFDCPPTGLVACTKLDPGSRVLSEHYARIVETYGNIALEDVGLDSLWRTFPTVDTRRLMEDGDDIQTILFGT